MSPPSNPAIAPLNALNTSALGEAGKSLTASAYAETAPAFAIMLAVFNVISPNRLIGAIGSVSPPSNPAIAPLNALNTSAAGDLGKSLTASAYALTAEALSIILCSSSFISPKRLIGAIGSLSPPSSADMPPLNAPSTSAAGDFGKSFIANAYAATAPAFATMLAVLRVISPKRFIGAIGSVSPPRNDTIPVANAPSMLGAGPPLKPAIASLYAIIALALFSICVVSNLASEKSFNFSKGLLPGIAPNILPITLPMPPSAPPAPNTNKPAPTAAIPLPAAINPAPSNSSKDFMPSAIVGNAFPTIHVAPATAAPIPRITSPILTPPSNTAGLANAAMPLARPLSTPPKPAPMPLPMFPIPLPNPAPALPPPGRPPPPLSLPPPPNNPPIPDISAFLTLFKANNPTTAPTISPDPDHNISLSQPPTISPIFKSPNIPLTSCSRTFPSEPTSSPFLPPKIAVIKSKSSTFCINPVIVSDSV